MAKAQVTISAVDKTQAAINSALRGMKSVERASKLTAKSINLAFGFLTGGVIVSAFRKVTEAAKKTEEGQRALLEMNKALRDPALVAAAENLTNILITGFTEAVKKAAKFIKFIRAEMISLGMIGPGETAQDAAAVIRGQIREQEAALASIQNPQAGMATFFSEQLQKDFKTAKSSIETQISLLQKQLQIVESLADEEAKRDAERIDRILREEKLLSTLTGVTVSSTKKVATSGLQALYQKWDSITATAIKKQADAFREFRSIIDEQVRSTGMSIEEANIRLREALDSILSEVKITSKKTYIEQEKTVDQITIFAEEAAKNMQSAFANFLFDPFQDGLRGMLKGFIDTIRRMVAEFAASQILKFFFSPFTGSKGFLGSFAKYVTGEPRAMGGSVMGGRPYLVGERGPELFVPGSNGSVVPNNRMGGFTLAPVYNIDARGATADLQQALPGILSENNRRIFDELDRRYGIGR